MKYQGLIEQVQSHVEAEVHDIALLHHVLLALQPQLALFARLLLAPGRHKVAVRDRLRADKSLLKVPGMDGHMSHIHRPPPGSFMGDLPLLTVRKYN